VGNINWKKMLLFGAVSAFAPTLSNWATSVQTGHDIPFTIGNIVIPAIPTFIITLAALFSNPRTKG
jgi:hypothetical protein